MTFMNHDTMLLLAASEEGFTKGIFAVIAVAIWAISAAMNSVKKQREERERRERFSRMEIPPPVPVPPVVQRQQKSPVRGAAPRQKKRVQQAPQRATPPPVPLATAPALSRGTQAGRSGEAPSPPRVNNATAASIHQWLRPETMRAQFILSEIFQPPLALRPPDQRIA